MVALKVKEKMINNVRLIFLLEARPGGPLLLKKFRKNVGSVINLPDN